jgi:hypothetical protein
MSFVANITPPAVVLLVSIVGYVSVRRAYRKAHDVAPAPTPKAEPAE